MLRAIRQELPEEDVLYVGDSGFAPYGDKPGSFVRERAAAIVEFLINEGAKAIVVACNTATGVAVDELRARFQVPIVAVEPAVKPASLRTRSGVVGVLATAGTVSSANLSRLVNTHGVDVRFLVQPSPGLAEQVEQGDFQQRYKQDLWWSSTSGLSSSRGGHFSAGVHALPVPQGFDSVGCRRGGLAH